MATMMKFPTTTQATIACKDDLRVNHANGMSPAGPVYVLRSSGDTDEFRINTRGIIRRVRHSGLITLGMVVNPSDLPCIISE